MYRWGTRLLCKACKEHVRNYREWKMGEWRRAASGRV